VQTDGRLTCADTRFTSMPSSGVMIAVVIYKYNVSDAAAPLLFYYDIAVAGLPATMDGRDVQVTWPAVGIAVL